MRKLSARLTVCLVVLCAPTVMAQNSSGVNNAELNGPYALTFDGIHGSSGGSAVFAFVGRFRADGAGNVTNGELDSNGTGIGALIAEPFTGTYEIGADHRGLMTLDIAGGTMKFALAMMANGNAAFIEFDASGGSGTIGSGSMEKVDTTAYNSAKIVGDYAFGATGADPNGRVALAGRFVSNGAGTLSSGAADVNDRGNIFSLIFTSGNYGVSDTTTGRGTMTLSFSFTGGSTTLNFVFYIVNAGKLFAMERDVVSTPTPLLNGVVLQQRTPAGGFTNASLSGKMVINFRGLSACSNITEGVPKAVIGLLDSQGNGSLKISFDENFCRAPHSVTALPVNYSVTSIGRLSMTVGTDGVIGYMVDLNEGFLFALDGSVLSGFGEPQETIPFNNSDITGDYAGFASTPTGFGVVAFSGEFTADGLSPAGSINGREDVGDPSGPVSTGFSAAYSVSSSPTNGRGTASLFSSSGGNAVFYSASTSKFVMVPLSDPNPSVWIFERSLSPNVQAPFITTPPQNQTVTAGNPVTFSVTATGTAPLTYQWQKNDVAIVGATSSSYTTPPTKGSDNRAQFDVVVRNSVGRVTSKAAILTVNVPPSITRQPASQAVLLGHTATFSVAVTGTAPLTYQWQKNGLPIAGATSSSYTTPPTKSSDNAAQFTVVVGNLVGRVTSNPATLTVATSFARPADVITYHYDVSRSGVNSNETALTTSNVNAATFGKVGEFIVDGRIDGQALFLSQLAIPGQGNKDVLYVATENDTVYAVDARSISGSSAAILWKTSVLPNGESPADSASLPCGNVNPNGVMATPVIDRARNAIYVEAMSKDSAGNIHHRLHALDLTNGKELFGGPTTIAATYPGTGGNSQGGVVTFDSRVHHERAALLESGNTIYTVWSGLFGDCGKYSAWVIAFDARTLQQTAVIDLVPNNSGGGMWMGGGGPAADASGNVYVITGNGFGDTPGTNSDYGNSFVRLSTSNGLKVADYFTPFNTLNEDGADVDFGSSGPLLLPDLVDANGIIRHLAVGAGKDGNLYVLDRDNLGQFNNTKNNVYQEFPLSSAENHSSPVFFNNTVYLCPENNPLTAFPVSQALLATSPSSQTAHQFGSNGTVASVSANGSAEGIVWALDWGAGILFAYDARDLAKELYDSNQAAGNRDHFSAVAGHFITPMVANGRVYFGTGTSVAVFGLLH